MDLKEQTKIIQLVEERRQAYAQVEAAQTVLTKCRAKLDLIDDELDKLIFKRKLNTDE